MLATGFPRIRKKSCELERIGLGVKLVNEARAVNVEGLQDVANLLHRNVPVERPLDDVQVFLAGFETIQDAIQKKWIIMKAVLDDPEAAPVQLNPEAPSLQVLEPACSQVPVPVLLHPTSNRHF